ncbi:MAG: DUF924 family protein [Paracoccus sp. (in: a-proteobacteria)]|nr:DUF924 family protein [Paracoccus sp. (in: a-proteobacteria)]
MTPHEISRFWLDEVGSEQWYRSTPELDAECRRRFLDAWKDAGRLAADWAGDAAGALAALILTDQLPRNMFRDDPRSFATDKLARSVADGAIGRGFDRDTPEPARQFFYMPFMHSEDLGDQSRAIQLFEQNMPGDNLRHARLHRDVIRAFGRFPWRNEVLGRESLPAERDFLAAGGYGALVSGRLSLDEPG